MTLVKPKTVEELALEDLARSGLTLDDIDGKAMDGIEAKAALGREDSVGSEGGYTIPYRTLDGNDIVENGKPFQRIRLVGPHSDDTPRYLSRGSTTAHVYIPKQLKAALADSKVGKTLLITEGEKKAVATCKAGFPCVALAGIQMYRDPKDKTKLLPELRDLLEYLFEHGAIDAVVVLLDSDGQPLPKKSLPSDENEARRYHEFKNGNYVKNNDVFKAALNLAGLIRMTVAGLPVGHGWVRPDVTVSADGPKGGKRRVVIHRGLDDVLVLGNAGIADLRTWVDEAKDRAEPGDGEGGFLPLGATADGIGIYLWSRHQDTLISLPANQLNNPATLAGLVGKSWLQQKYSRFTKDGLLDFDTKMAAIDVASSCASRGKFHVDGRVFGTGTWLAEDGTLIVNAAKKVFTQDGDILPRIAEDRKAIYTSSGSYPPPAYRKVSDEAYRVIVGKIVGGLDSWQYTSKLGSKLVLGWLVMSVFLGAMQSRPSLWLVAPRGSGKTHLARFMKSCLGGYAWHTDQGKESTSAGIRQMLQLSSSPCIMDEMEKDNTEMSIRSEGIVSSLLSLVRSAYTAGSEIKKGTADQMGKSFRIMTSFCLVSIADPALEPADLTRIAKIRMRPLQHEDGKLGRPPAPLSEDEAATFFWGTIQRWRQYQAIFSEVRDSWLALAGNGESREVDTFGVLLAASMAAHDHSVEEVRPAIEASLPHLMEHLQEVREASTESMLILDTLLTLKIEVQRHESDDNGNERILRENMGVARALLGAFNGKVDEALALADVGIKITTNDGQQYLAVRLRHAGLTRLFQGTRWNKDGAWTGGLCEIEGVVKNYPVKFVGKPEKCTLVPWCALGIERDGEQEKKPAASGAKPIPFPSMKTIL